MHRSVMNPGRGTVAVLAATVLLLNMAGLGGTREAVAQALDPEKVAKARIAREKDLQLDAMLAALGPAQAKNVVQAIEPFRPIFQVELRLLTSAAELTSAQRREIALEAGRTLKESVRVLALNNPEIRVGVTAPLSPDPRKMVRKHLEIAAWAKLSNIQSARYRAELERKAEDRKEIVILNIVANLDKQLRLNADQREKLCEALRTHWDDRDFPSLETSVVYDTYAPSLPDGYIMPILTENQAKVWRGMRKYHFSSIRTLNPLNDALAIAGVDVAEDDDVKAALGEEKK